ncbi:unnamed protein product [Gulo gulo]|uniref:Uncharacterized protein n=1 Tax=Gulo gulo TaxID=48420 RepID=A0A9X9LEY9_GULGU|nr:unnamed protein product [Gulo gulo]
MELPHGPLQGAAPCTSLRGRRPLGIGEVSVLCRLESGEENMEGMCHEQKE